MAYIETIPVQDAAGDVRRMYVQAQARLGYVPNYAKVFSHRPDVMAAWRNLNASVSGCLEPRRYELITLAAAQALRSSYCMLAHGTVLCEKFYEPDQLAAITQHIADDVSVEGFAPVDRTIMAFAQRIVRDATAISESDIQRLRDDGLSDAEIFDIAAAAAMRCFFSKLMDALGAEPDAAYLQLEEALQCEFTVGRAISRKAVAYVLSGIDQASGGANVSLPGIL